MSLYGSLSKYFAGRRPTLRHSHERYDKHARNCGMNWRGLQATAKLRRHEEKREGDAITGFLFPAIPPLRRGGTKNSAPSCPQTPQIRDEALYQSAIESQPAQKAKFHLRLPSLTQADTHTKVPKFYFIYRKNRTFVSSLFFEVLLSMETS